MFPRLPIPLILLATMGIPAPAEPDGAIWTATRVGETSYLPLENLRSFYKLLPRDEAGKGSICTVGTPDITLSFGPGKRDMTIGGYRLRLTHPVSRNHAGELLISKADMVKLVDPILRPTYIQDRMIVRTVVIDPGHGGQDTGIQAGGLKESAITLQIALKLRESLSKRGFRAVLTRQQDQYLSDQQRIDFANPMDGSIFISLHLNSGSSDAQGIETYAIAPAAPGETPRPGNLHDETNAALSFALHSSLIAATQAQDGAFRRVRYSLLSSINHPAALIQLGYATHEQESAALSNEAYQNKLAAALTEGIVRFAIAINPTATLQPQPDTEADRPPSTYTADPLPPAPENPPTGQSAPRKPQNASSPQPRKPSTRRSRNR